MADPMGRPTWPEAAGFAVVVVGVTKLGTAPFVNMDSVYVDRRSAENRAKRVRTSDAFKDARGKYELLKIYVRPIHKGEFS